MFTQLKKLHIERAEWGKTKGQLSGAVTFAGPGGEVTLPLDEQLSLDILHLCADGITRVTKALASELTAEVLTTNALPAPAAE